MVVIFQVAVDAETRPERRGQQTTTCSGADEGERSERELYRACTGTLVNHDVDAVVLHRAVEVFLDDGAQAVNLVDEQHIVLIE